jgi:cell division protease FtsH
MMGGRVAEELIFGQLTTGAANDLQQATDMARKMVCDWGMSEKLGPLHFGRHEEMVFLGRDFNEQRDYSEQTAIEIDAEVRAIVTENYQRAKKIVTDNLDKLKIMAETLLEYETIDGADIDVLMDGKRLARPPVVSTSDRARKPDVKDVKPEREEPRRGGIFGVPEPEKA